VLDLYERPDYKTAFKRVLTTQLVFLPSGSDTGDHRGAGCYTPRAVNVRMEGIAVASRNLKSSEGVKPHQVGHDHVLISPRILALVTTYLVFSRTLPRYVNVISRPSVVCLSSVTFVHFAQWVELFANIFAPSNSSGTWAVPKPKCELCI